MKEKKCLLEGGKYNVSGSEVSKKQREKKIKRMHRRNFEHLLEEETSVWRKNFYKLKRKREKKNRFGFGV